jgi:hypothetical protein
VIALCDIAQNDSGGDHLNLTVSAGSLENWLKPLNRFPSKEGLITSHFLSATKPEVLQ